MSWQPFFTKLPTEELQRRAHQLENLMSKCSICPHCCHVDRLKGEIGFCRAGEQIKVAGYGPHFGEEDVLVGTNGSGTIFFSYCSLRCQFCQNYSISLGEEGEEITPEELADIMLELSGQGCHNINLVSPTHYIPQIMRSLVFSVQNGLRVPLVFNTSGYESTAILEYLDGVIDIYMPDVKYMDEEYGRKYSQVKDYPVVVQNALKEMKRQVGDLQIEDGLAVRGLLVRHLVLPHGISGSKRFLEFIAEDIGTETYINLMDQYYPAYRAARFPELSGRVSTKEMAELVRYAKQLGLRRCIS